MMTRLSRRAAAAMLGAAFLPIAARAQDAIALPERIRRAGRLVVATFPNYPPLTYRDPGTNARLGFDVELAEAIARELRLTADWQEMPFVQFFPSLATGRIDFAVGGISDLPARRGPIDFVNYLRTGAQFLTLDRNVALRAPADLCGKRVGASRSTNWPRDIEAWSQANCVAQGRPPIAVVGTEGSVDARTQLRTERLDASVQGNETISWLQGQEPNIYRTLGQPFTSNLTGIPIASSEPVLRDAGKVGLERLLANDGYAALLRKHGLEANGLSAITINGG